MFMKALDGFVKGIKKIFSRSDGKYESIVKDHLFKTIDEVRKGLAPYGCCGVVAEVDGTYSMYFEGGKVKVSVKPETSISRFE